MKTKKIISALAISACSLLSYSGIGQSDAPQTFTQGMNAINLGVGFGGEYSILGSGYTQSPEFVASYENGTFGNVGPGTITLGGLLAYTNIGYSYSYYYGNNEYNSSSHWNYYIIGFRSAYHWNFTTNTKFDPYAGLMLGYYVQSYSHSTNDPNVGQTGDPEYGYVYSSANEFAVSAYIGARYFLSSNVGVWAELGFGYSNLAAGITFKF